MSDQELNPYAAPQAELSSSSSSIPLAQEVFQRNRFPEVSTADLDRVANASSSILALDTLYVLPCLFCFVILFLLSFVTYYNNTSWDWFKSYSIWAIVFVPCTIYTIMVAQRFSWSRYMGLLLDGVVTVLIIGCAVVLFMKLFVYGGLIVLCFAFFPARALQQRYHYPVLYGLDRVEHGDLIQELYFRRTHHID
jgi:hypothetical protein